MTATLVDTPTTPLPVPMGPQAGKYLVFHLGPEEFGIQVLKVREIIGIQTITAVPQTPAYVKGVINLRGRVVPIVDLRLKCGLPETDHTQRTCIIVVQVQVDGNSVWMGVIVDGVAEVMMMAEGEIEGACDFGYGVKVPYLLGLAKVKGKVKILLDIDQVMSSQDLRGLKSVMR